MGRLTMLVLLLAATAAAGLAPSSAPAASPATLSIPKLGIRSAVIRYATTANQEAMLAYGPIWWPGEPGRPGDGIPIAIAGHDVTPVPGFGAHGPFNHLYELAKGALLTIRWKGKLFRYRMSGRRILPESDLNVVQDHGHESVMLSTCWPPYQKVNRMYVWFLPAKH